MSVVDLFWASFTVNCLLVTFLVLGFMLMPPTAKLLLRKRLGMLKDRTLNLIAYDDGVLVMEAQTVSTEGILESEPRGKKGSGKSFYLASPLDDVLDVDVNKNNAERDKVMLPLFNIDGFPVAFSYVRAAIATNPHTIAALRFARSVDPRVPRELPVAIKIPGAVAAKVGLKENYVKLRVVLPIDPRDIRRHFSKYWGMDVIEATKIRYQNIGALSNRKDGEKMFKLLLIIGAVMGIAFAVVGLLAGRFV